MINASSDDTIALRPEQQAALNAPAAGGQINLVQATNVAHNLTPAEFLLPSPSADTPSQPPLIVASASNFAAETQHESAAMSFALTEKTLLQFSAEPADERFRQRSASSPLISAGEQPPERETMSASAPTYLNDAAKICDTISAAKTKVRTVASPFKLLRATIAGNLSVQQKRTEQQKKLSVLERMLEKRRPGIRLELCDLDLSGLDFRTLRMPLDNIHFINCQFTNAHLPRALNHCQLTECEADNISLNNVVLTDCGIISSRFNRVNMQSTRLIDCTLSYVEMRNAQATEVLFSGTVLTACNWSGATLTLCKFPGATLANNIWQDTTTRDNLFNGATLIGSFRGANFRDDSMRNVTIAEADFTGVILADNCTLAPPTKSQLRRYFDAAAPLSVKLLNAIHSSEEGDLAIKTRLVRQLIKPLDLTCISVPPEVARTLLATLAYPPYRDDQRIYPFFMALLPAIDPVSTLASLPEDARDTWHNALRILRAPASLVNRVSEEHSRHTKVQILNKMVNRASNGSTIIMHGVNFQSVTFKGWNFSRSDLSWGDFRGCQFNECTFSNSQLRSALLQKCYFINCDLSDNVDMTAAVLTDASLINCKLNRLEASRIDLTRVRMENVEMQDANLSGAAMSGSYLINSNLNGCDLSEACLHSARLVLVDLNKTLMAQCVFDNSTLSNVSLIHADLATASLVNLDLINVYFRNSKLNSSMTLQFPQWDETQLGLYLDHFAHPEGSLLETLRRIPDNYTALKITLAEQLVSSLRACNRELTPYIKPLMDTLGHEFWRQSALIQTFNYELIEQHLTAHDLRALPALGARALIGILENIRDNLSLACNHHNAFTQIINQAVFDTERDDVRKLALRLYNEYLQQPVIIRAIEQRNSLRIVNSVRAAETDWQDLHAANFLLISAQQDGPLMLLSGANLQLMLATEPVSWDLFWLINNGRVLELADYTTAQLVEHHFPLFHDAWLAQQRVNPLRPLMTALNPGNDLYTLFMNALSQPVSSRKLTDFASVQALEKIFLPLLEFTDDSSRECSMTKPHYQQILDLYELNNASDLEKAEVLFCIAIIFTRLSSATHFGDEENSPHPIRFYGASCMTQAYLLCPDMFIVAPPPTQVAPSIDYYPGWKDRLLGTAEPETGTEQNQMMIVQEVMAEAEIQPDEAAEPDEQAPAQAVNYVHCSDTLATQMLGLAQMVCPEIAKRFYPPTWNG